jgi:hypothetical protein
VEIGVLGIPRSAKGSKKGNESQNGAQFRFERSLDEI